MASTYHRDKLKHIGHQVLRIEIALVKVGQWVGRIVCEVVSVVLDAIGGLVGLGFAIPILGRLLRPPDLFGQKSA